MKEFACWLLSVCITGLSGWFTWHHTLNLIAALVTALVIQFLCACIWDYLCFWSLREARERCENGVGNSLLDQWRAELVEVHSVWERD